MVRLIFRRTAAAAALLILTLGATGAGAPGLLPAPKFPDVTVQTQTGQKIRFSELLKGRTVAINFIFTSCPSVCPLMGVSFGRLQTMLGKRSADVTLISVSIDPETDTPARLAAWGKRFNAKPGWTLVTGKKADIDRLLKAAGAFSPDAGSHTPVALIGDPARGVWRRVDGLAPPATMLAVIDDVSTAKVANR
jgi:protein SCO1/2